MSLNPQTTDAATEAGPGWRSLQQAAEDATKAPKRSLRDKLTYEGKHRMTPAEEAEAKAAHASRDTTYEGRRRRLI